MAAGERASASRSSSLPTSACAWARFAPALGDSFRQTYRRLLRWNDELPFVRVRSPRTADHAHRRGPGGCPRSRAVGRALARLVAVCDLLHEKSSGFLGEWATLKPVAPTALLERYAAEVAELEAPTRSSPASASERGRASREPAIEPAVRARCRGGGAAPEAVIES
jgi:hypothetical protein